MTAQIIAFPRKKPSKAHELPDDSPDGIVGVRVGRMDKTVSDATTRLLNELFASGNAWRPVTPEWVAHMEAVFAGDE